MRIVAIGDPHGDLKKVRKINLKKIDLILLTGDLGKADLARKLFFEDVNRKQKGLPKLKRTKKQKAQITKEIQISTKNVLKYLAKQVPVYSIQGNVGIPNKKQILRIPKFHLVKNQVRLINGLRIGFLEFFTDTNWVEDFKPKDYKKELKKAREQTLRARKILKRFGKVDILVHHQPPYKVLDKVGKMAPKIWQGKHAGSKAVLEYIKKKQPRYALCGHIHEGEGKKKIGKTEVYNLGVAGHKVISF